MRRFAWALLVSLLWTGCIRGIAAQSLAHGAWASALPDVALAMVVAFALYRPAQPTLLIATFAVLSGCLYDLQTSAPTGMHGLCFLLLALCVQRARRSLLLASAPQVILLAFFALFVEEAIVVLLTEGLGMRVLWSCAFVTLRAGGAALTIPYLVRALDRPLRPSARRRRARVTPTLLRSPFGGTYE